MAMRMKNHSREARWAVTTGAERQDGGAAVRDSPGAASQLDSICGFLLNHRKSGRPAGHFSDRLGLCSVLRVRW